jgi:hypothetical protein
VSDEVEPRSTDTVEVRAEREGDTLVMRMSRGAAVAERVQLEAEGWRVRIDDVGSAE